MLSGLLLSAVLQFLSPVHIPITLAGNFGEPRPNHFHGGIDIRTEQVEGKPVFAIAEGYVYRITMGNGYGNALYVRHPNGQTSVYAHLQGFVPSLRAEVSKWRLSHGQEDVIDTPHHPSVYADIVLESACFPVAQGQLIAMSGDTGSSQAPHLHLEIHDTKTWSIVDPLDILRGYVKDTQPPVAHAFMAYPVAGEGVFAGKTMQQSFPFTSNNMEKEFSAWGKVGFGLWADDHMEECYQKYGIRKTILKVDGQTVFESNVDSIPWAMNRFVNAWGDYDHYQTTRVWYMKSFVDPGNPLPILKADARRGIVQFSDERPYHVEYTLTDAFGNESKYSFVVRGRRQEIPAAPEVRAVNLLHWDRMNSIQLPGMQLTVRPGLLAGHLELTPEVDFRPGALSDAYTFRKTSSPVVRPAIVSIRLKKTDVDPASLYMERDGQNIGGELVDGWLTASTLDLGGVFVIASTENKYQEEAI